MKTPLYRIRFKRASASGTGGKNLSPDELHPAATTLAASIESALPTADLYPAPLPLSYNHEASGASTDTRTSPASARSVPDETQPIFTQAEVRKMIDERLDALRIYVLESDITQAQQAVKSVVELASF